MDANITPGLAVILTREVENYSGRVEDGYTPVEAFLGLFSWSEMESNEELDWIVVTSLVGEDGDEILIDRRIHEKARMGDLLEAGAEPAPMDAGMLARFMVEDLVRATR